MESSRSVVVKKFGGYDAISIQDFKLPPLDDKVEVKVEYAGLNFADLYLRQGLMYDKKLPLVLGLECTGVITAIGAKDTDFKIGQRVVCYDYTGGMYRETTRVAPGNVYALPDQVAMDEGAAIFVNYLTAYFAIFDLGHLKKNESVLILSCAGGVGWAGTQLCKTVDGVKVYGTASAGKEADAKSNGIEAVFCLETLESEIQTLCPDGFDLIISNQSGHIFTQLQTFLKPLGRIVLIGANNIIQNERKLSMFSLMKLWLGTKNISLESLITKNRVVAGLHLGTLIDTNPERVREALRHIFELFEEKKLKPKICSILPMSKIVEATKLLAERKNVGKVLITMKEAD